MLVNKLNLDSSQLVPGTPESIPVPKEQFWVFAYGSLMWNPGFEFQEVHTGTLYGFHRRLCLWSVRYRGSEDRPGLVLGLDRGGSCRGYVYLIDNAHTKPVVEYLCKRELLIGSYQPKLVSVTLVDGCKVTALTFISKPDHPHFAPRMTLEQTVQVVEMAQGARGCNHSYVTNTVTHLDQLGIHDTELHHVAKQLKRPGSSQISNSNTQSS